jgi:hypothetical protein
MHGSKPASPKVLRLLEVLALQTWPSSFLHVKSIAIFQIEFVALPNTVSKFVYLSLATGYNKTMRQLL